jgi:hypothetical protein
MLAHFGVIAYFIWNLSRVGLLLLAPICWLLPVRFAWIYLGLIVCNRLIWWAVLSRLEAEAWFHFALGTLIFAPVVATVLVSIARKSKMRLSIKLIAFAAMFATPPAIAMVGAPYWFDAVQAAFIGSAKASAGGRLYCVFKFVDDGLPPKDVSVRELLLEATYYRGEYSPFYALLIIDNGTDIESMYWSFRTLTFIDVPTTFALSRSKRPCKPTSDPFATRPTPE